MLSNSFLKGHFVFCFIFLVLFKRFMYFIFDVYDCFACTICLPGAYGGKNRALDPWSWRDDCELCGC